MDKYRKLKVIGKGSFGFAVLVRSVDDRQTYVMKIIDVSKMDRKQREDAINEVHVLKAMRHPYIVTYKESFMDKRCLCIVMDYADGGDLYTKIANQKKIGKVCYTEDQILDRWIFCGNDSLVREVWSAGRQMVVNGRHIKHSKIEKQYRNVIQEIQKEM